MKRNKLLTGFLVLGMGLSLVACSLNEPETKVAEEKEEKKIEETKTIEEKEEKVKEALEGMEKITYCYNPFFDVTNSLASLWFAREEMDDDLIIMNADVFFTEEILTALLKDKRSPVMAIDRSRVQEGDYFFKTAWNGRIEKYGKGLPIELRSCEYVGMAKVEKSFLPLFKKRMEEMIRSQQHSAWWENVLYSFTDQKEQDIYTVDVDGKFWAEIDYFDDYERIIDYVAHTRESRK